MSVFGFPVKVACGAALLVCACAPAPSSVPEPREEPSAAPQAVVSLQEEFSLSPGETAAIMENGATVEFAEVTEDSRCPIGARCIWAGQVTVLLRVAPENASPSEVKLTLRVDEDQPASEQVGDLIVRLLSVQPYPEEKPIQRGDYVATLVVEAAAGQGGSR